MKGFAEPLIERVIADLKSIGLIDDAKLASSLARYADETKRLSVLGARRFLAERGVPSGLIEETVEGIDEASNAGKLVEKKLASLGKYGRNYDPVISREVFRRLYGMLYRRGFPPEAIKKALEQLK